MNRNLPARPAEGHIAIFARLSKAPKFRAKKRFVVILDFCSACLFELLAFRRYLPLQGVVGKMALESFPKWVGFALQGITYWIGHRRCVYRHYPLAEAALVAEICNLIYTHLENDFVLQCEVMYSNLLTGKVFPSILTTRARADIVVVKQSKFTKREVPKFVIEVKRASALRTQIDADLRRLSAVRLEHDGIRTFMFLVAEAQRPTRFVGIDGASIQGRHAITESKGYYRVRRTWKAAHAFRSRDTAQYACLLEVYAPPARAISQKPRVLGRNAPKRNS